MIGDAPKNDNTVRIQEQEKITISDVAEALGISKTTVSRAISGKGRIGEATRQRVMEYISENNYSPSVMAKGLAKSKTYNIGWVVPGDYTVSDLPFFQRCMLGISEISSAQDYDIVISFVYENDISQLERIVRNHKVDGIILGRSLIKDKQAAFLKENNIPFVVIGSSTDDEIIQIDNDHVKACEEITSILLLKGIRNPGLIGGDSNHVVNQTRYNGYMQGLSHQFKKPDSRMIYMDSTAKNSIERAVDDLLRKSADCIICMDDYICQTVLDKLHRENIIVPDDIKIASFYNSPILASNQPSITALQYDAKELGSVACRTLFDFINGKEIKRKIYLGYEVVLKGSTN